MSIRRLPEVAWDCPHGLHVYYANGTQLSPHCPCPKEPTGVNHAVWISTLASRQGAVTNALLGSAVRFAHSGAFDVHGRQTVQLTYGHLSRTFGLSEKAWGNSVRDLRGKGWLTQYADWRDGGEGDAPPLYLLTIPPE